MYLDENKNITTNITLSNLITIRNIPIRTCETTTVANYMAFLWFMIEWNLYHMTRKVLLKTHKFHHLLSTVFTISCLFSLSWETTCLERPQNLVVALYRFHCITTRLHISQWYHYNSKDDKGIFFYNYKMAGHGILFSYLEKSYLNFNEHVRNICQTASCQINALKRISNFLNEQCRMNVYKSFISANFNYCPIVWLFCGKTNLNKLEKLQERALATVFCDNSLTYEDMLEKSGQLRIRLNLIRLVAIDMFKCMNDLNPLYINEMFIGKDSGYNLRDQSRLLQPKFNTKRYGYRSFKYFGSKVWNCLPPSVKNVNDLSVLKKYLYNWCLTDHAKKLLEQLEL